MAEIKAGDTVRLKSGGPKMTVKQVGEAANGLMMAWCDWFDGMKPMHDAFPITSLEAA
jgi:uncharacterized protein YodC (DUF2158 family)